MPTYCFSCRSDTIQEVVQENKRYFYCSACEKLSDRVIDSRYGKDVSVPGREGEIIHVSAGAYITRDNQMLIIKRRGYPFGYSFPAGHVEYGEKPVEGLRREIFEELGLKVTNPKLIFNEEIQGNKCRYGADSHIWYFYHVPYTSGNPILNPEIEGVGWYTKEEANELNLVPVAHFLLHEVIMQQP